MRAIWRLARVALHLLHGLAVVWLELPRSSPTERARRIGWWSARLLRLLGIALHADGAPRRGAKLLVANHVSWLDIVAIHAVCPEARFVAKADVVGWPVLAGLIAAAGTLYIRRDSKRDALHVIRDMAVALRAGATIAVFPEGTTSDGRGVLRFHANLLQAAIAAGAAVQPLALRYADDRDPVSPAAAYVGDTPLWRSLWRVARARGLVVRLQWLPERAAGSGGRRVLAHELRAAIGTALREKRAVSSGPGQR